MKKLITSIVVVLFFIVNGSPVKAQDSKAGDHNTDLNKAEQMPAFKGGETKLFEFISSNIKYPKVAKDQGIEGKVFVNFVVDKSGKVRDAEIVRGISPEYDQEVLRIISIMPEWIPGKQDGKAVSVKYVLPVSFALNQPEQKKVK